MQVQRGSADMSSPFAFLGINTGSHAGPSGPQGMGPMPGGPLPAPMPPPPPPSGHLHGPLHQGPPPLGPLGHQVDPATNNAPLQFNMNKGKPPMAIPGKPGEDMPRDKDNDIDEGAVSPLGMQGSIVGPNLMGGPMGFPMMGAMGTGDPNMMMMGPMGFNQFGQFLGPGMPPGTAPIPPPVQKEIITIKSCTLYPPPPNAPPPSTRERPPGCRTIFVGGLPENITEDIIREIFESCGPLCSVRLSKKNFSHIRFEREDSVEKALYISGYRIKLDNQEDKPNTGRIHVDYAQARDDLYEWECKQRAAVREHRHRQRLEEERLRPPSPPPIIHYSDHEASLLLEKLKGDETFMKGIQVLITWLERGDSNRRTSNTFYSMIQCVNSHVRRLLNEKSQHDEELEAIRLKFRQRLEGILRQFEQIESVFSSASKQKAWDHFSKAQRKNIDLWRKQAQEIRVNQQEEFLKDRVEAEMDLSDSEDSEGPIIKKRKEDVAMGGMSWEEQAALYRVKDENDQLKCQLEAYKNEVDLLKQESQNATDDKDKQIKALQQALQGMQQQLISSKTQMKKDEEELQQLRIEKLTNGSEKRDTLAEVNPISSGAASATTPPPIDEKEARLIGLMSTFLHVHPFGASVDYIWSYLQRLEINIRSSEIEDLLEKLPNMFRQDLHGVGATLEKRWKFIAFNK